MLNRIWTFWPDLDAYWLYTIPSMGDMGWRSTATIFAPSFSFSFLDNTCDQLPGAAHKSTTLFTPSNILNLNKHVQKHFMVSSCFRAYGPTLNLEKWILPFVNLKKFKCWSGSPSLLFCQSIVNISLIFWRFTHS